MAPEREKVVGHGAKRGEMGKMGRGTFLEEGQGGKRNTLKLFEKVKHIILCWLKYTHTYACM